MRIAFSVSVLVCLLGCRESARVVVAPEPSSVTARTASAGTRVEIRSGATTQSVDVPRDSTVAADAEPRVRMIGEVPGVAVAIADRYPSVAGGLSYCQAGEEEFLRVVSVAKGAAEQTYQVKVASCRDNLELMDPGIEWVAGQSTVRIHWLQGPGGSQEVRTIRIASDGSARVIPSP